MNKETARKRRAKKSRAVIRNARSSRPRLVVHRSCSHIYAQILVTGDNGDLVIASASTVDKELRTKLEGNKVDQAVQVGKLLAERATKNEIKDIAFDRAGYKYHGRVKALADGAREGGLNF
ncbi:MAG: 50S ribosomal protein L18 [Legionellales bacterium RIFCSPHIGHO2_12_FULL_35_11]|nr:MAG: 50S ribosomal protein L18 [Legionellales bacterium RIFCSPHIGHO2_12_FULL_35_11]